MVRNGQFKLSQEQWEKYDAWEQSLPEHYFGCDNNGITFHFSITSIGIIVIKVTRNEGEELDLTDYSD